MHRVRGLVQRCRETIGELSVGPGALALPDIEQMVDAIHLALRQAATENASANRIKQDATVHRHKSFKGKARGGAYQVASAARFHVFVATQT